MVGTKKESKSKNELIEIALAEIQSRKIGGIYNINVSSDLYGSALDTWRLIINQRYLHDDDPIVKDYLDQESPSQKQWRYSLIEIERELQRKFELQDSKKQPHVPHNPPAGAVEKSFDRAKVRKIVEDHFRSILPLRGYGRRPQNMTQIEQMGNRLADQVEAWCNSLPPDQAKELDNMFGDEMQLSLAECQRDPVAYARRLGVLPGRGYQRQGIGEMAVRTAVRATIWEGVRRLFWR
jgi:hypothetical protein